MKFNILRNIGLIQLLNKTTISSDGKCVSINTESTDNMCGIKIPLQTTAGNFYTINIKGCVLSGEKVSVFCVSNAQNLPLIENKYFLTNVEKEYTVVFQAVDMHTIIGIVPMKKYISHKIEIDTLICQSDTTFAKKPTVLQRRTMPTTSMINGKSSINKTSMSSKSSISNRMMIKNNTPPKKIITKRTPVLSRMAIKLAKTKPMDEDEEDENELFINNKTPFQLTRQLDHPIRDAHRLNVSAKVSSNHPINDDVSDEESDNISNSNSITTSAATSIPVQLNDNNMSISMKNGHKLLENYDLAGLIKRLKC